MSPNEFGLEKSTRPLALGKSQSIQHDRGEIDTQQSPLTINSASGSIPQISRKLDKSPNTHRKIEPFLRTDPLSRSPISDKGDQEEEILPEKNLMQRNIDRLEEMKAKRAQEIKDLEDQREKTRRRQEKLKNIILKEAEDNRARKKEQEALSLLNKERDDLEAEKPKPKPILEPDEEEKQKQQMLMRKYYRNRHATFMKALLDKKKSEQEQMEEIKAKEERKKKKVRDKVLGSLAEVGNGQTESEVVPMKRTTSVIGRTHRSSSLSVQHSDAKKFMKVEQQSTTVSSILPNSKEEKKRQMKEVYGVTDDLREPRRKLNRVSSKGSMRSSHSVQTPMVSRKGRHQPGQAQAQVTVMPSLKKQN